MPFTISHFVASVAPSATLAVSAKAAAMRADGVDVLSLSAGEPDFDTPDFIKDAAIKAIRDGKTKYTDVRGIGDLRAAIAAKFKRENGLSYSPEEVLVSCGAKQSVYNVFHALLNPGDEVIIPAPCWVSYPEMARLVGAKPVIVPAPAERDFNPTREALERAATRRTRMIVFSTPGNPTGAVFSRATLETIADFARARDLLIISDEIYEKLLYDGAQHLSIASLSDDAKARTVVVNGHSKTYAMTGWRIGYAAGPRAVIHAMGNIQSHTTSNPNTPAQYAALAALTADQKFLDPFIAAFDRRRRALAEGLARLPGVACRMPQGAFYAFPDFSALYGRKIGGFEVRDSLTCATALLEGAHVATVPGEGFCADAHQRFSYAVRDSAIADGLARLAKFLAG
ncbi:MAG: pyridoxal phosphate-dependent aminotransferase [Planctomycetes bacterium]|nr:pyridoxal phosphate-dependent aminotransferase [Planctomycetota bacterium]